MPRTWLLTSAERDRAPAGSSLTRRHRSPLPCDGAETPCAAVTRTPMTHLLPPSKSCWHRSHFDESLSILSHRDPCALSHTHPLRSLPRSLHTDGLPESPFSGVTPTLVRLGSISPFLALRQRCLLSGGFQHTQLPTPPRERGFLEGRVRPGFG